MVKAVVIPSDLGTEFDLGVAQAGKIRLKLGANLSKNAATGAIDAATGTSSGGFTTPFFSAPAVTPYSGFKTLFEPIHGLSTSSTLGTTLTFVGTATARAITNATVATSRRRLGIVSAATAGALSSAYHTTTWVGIGNAGATLGGFLHVGRFTISDGATVAGARMFYGLRSTVAAPTNVEPSSLTNILGFGHGAADNSIHIYGRGAGALTELILSNVDFPITAGTPYLVAIYAPRIITTPGFVSYLYIKNEATGLEQAMSTSSVSSPLSTVMLSFAAWRTNNATALAVGLDLGSHLFDTYI